MGRASRARRRRRDAAQRREALAPRRDPDVVATATLRVVCIVAALVVATGWWADTRIGAGAVPLGVVVGRRNAELLTFTVPGGTLALTAFALMCVPVVLAVLGCRATRRGPTMSRLTGAAAVVAVAAAPGVVVTYVATVLDGPGSGWVLAGQMWPAAAGMVAVFVVGGVADGIRPGRTPPRR